jgi:hypothetical protein
MSASVADDLAGGVACAEQEQLEGAEFGRGHDRPGRAGVAEGERCFCVGVGGAGKTGR